MIELSHQNLAEYLKEKSKEIPLQIQEIKSIEEVKEHTFVNWNFRVTIATKEGDQIVYVRQARGHLKAVPEWEIDSNRIIFEAKILRLLQNIVPGAVPKVIFLDKENKVCILSYIKKEGQILLDELKKGNSHPEGGKEFGFNIAKIHGKTLGITDNEVRGSKEANDEAIKFNFDIRFDQGKKAFPKEAEDIFIQSKNAKTALVLGDLASKNIIVEKDKTRFLDLELAFIGDPAFDIGFLLCHYLLQIPKSHLADSLKFAVNFMQGYRDEIRKYISKEEALELENRAIRILGITLLYRIFDEHFSIQTEEAQDYWKEISFKLLSDKTSTNLPDALYNYCLKD